MNFVKKIFKNTFTYLTLIIVLLSIFLVQTVSSVNKLSSHGHALVSYDYKYHFSLDLENTETSLAKEFLRGANEVAEKLNIAIETNEINSSYTGNNLDFIRWATFTQTDAIISVGTSEKEFVLLSDWINEAGMTCCIVYNDIPCKGMVYVGPDNYQQGYDLAMALSERCKDELLYIGLLYSPIEKYISSGRLSGFLDGANRCPNLIVLEKHSVEASVLRGMGVAEDIILRNADINYFVCLDETLLTGAVRGIVDLNKVKRISASGIGYSDEIAGYIKNKLIDVTVDSNAYLLGKYAVETAYYQKQHKSEEAVKDIITHFSLTGG